MSGEWNLRMVTVVPTVECCQDGGQLEMGRYCQWAETKPFETLQRCLLPRRRKYIKLMKKLKIKYEK